MRILVVAAVLALAAGSVNAKAGAVCTKGKACGDGCIAKSDHCNKPRGTATNSDGSPEEEGGPAKATSSTRKASTPAASPAAKPIGASPAPAAKTAATTATPTAKTGVSTPKAAPAASTTTAEEKPAKAKKPYCSDPVTKKHVSCNAPGAVPH